jgi:hypothetical protein
MSTLHPLHLEDLRKSGLSDETIIQSGIATVPPADINRRLGSNIPGLISCLEFPYDKTYSRFKVSFNDNGNGKRPKYLQPKGSGNRLYIFHGVRHVLNDPSNPLYITEGEKKALKATQEGLCCIAIPGLWNYSNGNGELIPDFDQIHLQGREVYIVPDSDYLQSNKHGYRKNLNAAVKNFAWKLIERGAQVFIKELPPVNNGDKVGLDDFLVQHTVNEFLALPSVEVKSLFDRVNELQEEDVPAFIGDLKLLKSETERALLASMVSKKFKIGRRSILKDISKEKDKPNEQRKYCANFAGLIDIVENKDGEPVYLVKSNNSLRIEVQREINGDIYYPPTPDRLPYVVNNWKTLPLAEDVLHWYSADDNKVLFEDVLRYLKRFAFLPDRTWLIIAAKIFLTYLQDNPNIHYLPILLFRASPERGKSRTCKATIAICYRGLHVSSFNTPNILRYASYFQSTIFFDVTDIWKKAEKTESEDILLCRFEKGAMVTRVLHPDKGPFEDMSFFSIYGPTLIATNKDISHIFGTRSIEIVPPNRPGVYDDKLPQDAAVLRSRLLALRARFLNEKMPHVDYIPKLRGRLWDISKPLLQVCKLVHPDSLDDLRDELMDIAIQRLEARQDTLEGRIAEIITELSEGQSYVWEIPLGYILEKLNENFPNDKKYNAHKLGWKIKGMSLSTRKSHGVKHVILDEENLRALREQYLSIPEDDKNSQNSPISPNPEQATVCDPGTSGEFLKKSPESPLPQSVDIQGKGELGEIGDLLSAAGEKITITNFRMKK